MKIDLEEIVARRHGRWTNPKWQCPVCYETFDMEVWHCPLDAHHWPLGRGECHNCHNVELIWSRYLRRTKREMKRYWPKLTVEQRKIMRWPDLKEQ